MYFYILFTVFLVSIVLYIVGVIFNIDGIRIAGVVLPLVLYIIHSALNMLNAQKLNAKSILSASAAFICFVSVILQIIGSEHVPSGIMGVNDGLVVLTLLVTEVILLARINEYIK